MELSFGIRVFFARWGRPDVVLVVSPALFSAAFAVTRARFGFCRQACGIWVQDIYSRGFEETSAGGGLPSKLMKKLEGKVLRMATQVSVIHGRFEEYLTKSLGVPQRDVRVIRNWTHIEHQGGANRAQIRARHGWKDEDFIVLHAGNMGVKQGLENVVSAARLASAKKSNIRFVLLGDGNQRRRIQQQAHGVDHIEFIAPLPDADYSDVLRSADILLVNELPGLRETAVPSKLTSYFSAGLPVIAATETDSITADEIRSSGGGVVAEPGNPEALLRAAEHLEANKHISARLAQAGVHFANTELSESAALVQYTEWLNQLAATGRGTRTGAFSEHMNQN